MKPELMGLIRHILTFGGGYAVANGIATAANVEIIVAGVITILGVAWSAMQKKNKAP